MLRKCLFETYSEANEKKCFVSKTLESLKEKVLSNERKSFGRMLAMDE